jgi:hypothetical protein
MGFVANAVILQLLGLPTLSRDALQDNQRVPIPFRRGKLRRPGPARRSDAVRQHIALERVNPARVQARRVALIDGREIDQVRLAGS